ncbi:MAG: Gfo/Idh/MocA family protein [Thermomicrobiales bacterium]
MARLRIGVVGVGYMGQRFARLAVQHPLADLAGVADVNEAVAGEVAAGFGVPAYGSAAALVEAGRLDALVVATIEDAHVEPCLAALERGIPVLVEKPLASTEEDALAILAAAALRGTPLMVGHVLRFDARYAGMSQAVVNGEIGTPLTFAARRLNGVGAQNRLKGRCSLPIFLGVHDYDVVRWALGSEVTAVTAVSKHGHLSGMGYQVEDANIAVLTLDNGAVGFVELGWVLPPGHPSGFDQRFEVTGTAGQVTVDGAYSGFTVVNDVRTRWPETTIAAEIDGAVRGSLERELDHFVTSILAEREPSVTGRDGLIAVRIALAVDEAARTGQAIQLTKAV